MTGLETRRILFRLLHGNGVVPVIVVDVDAFARFAHEAGEAAGTQLLQKIRGRLELLAGASGEVHALSVDRWLVGVPSARYEEAVALAERAVDEVRALDVRCPTSVSPTGRVSVTAGVVLVESAVDIERFDRVMNDLLRDGKSTGGDVAVHDRAPWRP